MKPDVDKLLEELRSVSPPHGMEDRIIAAVDAAARRRQFWVGLLASVLAPAVLLLVWSIRLLAADLATSPLVPLLRLQVSDAGAVFASYGDWALAVLEAIPIGSLILTLVMLLSVVTLASKLRKLSRTGVSALKAGLANE